MSKPTPDNAVPRSSSFRSLCIADLVIDPEAQRRLVDTWVKKEVPRFDPEKLGHIVVNKRTNGKLYVIDGQRYALSAGATSRSFANTSRV